MLLFRRLKRGSGLKGVKLEEGQVQHTSQKEKKVSHVSDSPADITTHCTLASILVMMGKGAAHIRPAVTLVD